jgi:hypothetical protein
VRVTGPHACYGVLYHLHHAAAPCRVLTVEDRLPAVLRAGARRRQPLTPEGYQDLIETSLTERRIERQGDLERATGSVHLPVPDLPPGRPPQTGKPLPAAPDATGGTVNPMRIAWVAKYDPLRATREKALPPAQRTVSQSDVFTDYSWGDPDLALDEPWIKSWLMRGAPAAIAGMRSGDLVFATRTQWKAADNGWLKRRTIVGVWCVDSTVTWPEADADGRISYPSQAICFPLRRFDFPVPIKATSDMDKAFDDVQAFHDTSQVAVIELSAAEALAVVRACGMPAEALTEPNPNQLAPLLRNLDLGPPTVVRKRILEGARAAAHRFSVERAARDVAVGALRRVRMAVVSTEREPGLGSDLWARCTEADGTEADVRIEVKGLSGSNPWQARLTKSERLAAIADAGRGGWFLVIVNRALRKDRNQRWLSSTEAASVFTVPNGAGHYAADQAAGAALDARVGGSQPAAAGRPVITVQVDRASGAEHPPTSAD